MILCQRLARDTFAIKNSGVYEFQFSKIVHDKKNPYFKVDTRLYLEGGGENGGQLFLGFETNKDGVQYLTKKTPWDGLFVFFGAVSGVVSII